ncbi:MAG: ECF transporter S component [Christensenellales bacterium]
MRSKSVKELVLAALFLALGLVLPFLTMQLPSMGSMLLPMHLPVLLCGFICGWQYGLAVGFITPLLRSVLFGMPPMIPVAFAMAFELAAYGFLTGLLYKLLPKKTGYLFVTLILAMIGGRIAWGIASYFLYGLGETVFTWQLFVSGAFLNAIPGIIIQIVIIPLIMMALKRTKYLQEV